MNYLFRRMQSTNTVAHTPLECNSISSQSSSETDSVDMQLLPHNHHHSHTTTTTPSSGQKKPTQSILATTSSKSPFSRRVSFRDNPTFIKHTLFPQKHTQQHQHNQTNTEHNHPQQPPSQSSHLLCIAFSSTLLVYFSSLTKSTLLTSLHSTHPHFISSLPPNTPLPSPPSLLVSCLTDFALCAFAATTWLSFEIASKFSLRFLPLLFATAHVTASACLSSANTTTTSSPPLLPSFFISLVYLCGLCWLVLKPPPPPPTYTDKKFTYFTTHPRPHRIKHSPIRKITVVLVVLPLLYFTGLFSFPCRKFPVLGRPALTSLFSEAFSTVGVSVSRFKIREEIRQLTEFDKYKMHAPCHFQRDFYSGAFVDSTRSNAAFSPVQFLQSSAVCLYWSRCVGFRVPVFSRAQTQSPTLILFGDDVDVTDKHWVTFFKRWEHDPTTIVCPSAIIPFPDCKQPPTTTISQTQSLSLSLLSQRHPLWSLISCNNTMAKLRVTTKTTSVNPINMNSRTTRTTSSSRDINFEQSNEWVWIASEGQGAVELSLSTEENELESSGNNVASTKHTSCQLNAVSFHHQPAENIGTTIRQCTAPAPPNLNVLLITIGGVLSPSLPRTSHSYNLPTSNRKQTPNLLSSTLSHPRTIYVPFVHTPTTSNSPRLSPYSSLFSVLCGVLPDPLASKDSPTKIRHVVSLVQKDCLTGVLKRGGYRSLLIKQREDTRVWERGLGFDDVLYFEHATPTQIIDVLVSSGINDSSAAQHQPSFTHLDLSLVGVNDNFSDRATKIDSILSGLLLALDKLGLGESLVTVVAGLHANVAEDQFACVSESCTRVPLLFTLPTQIFNRFNNAHHEARLARQHSLLDIHPTILHLLSLPSPPTITASSWLRQHTNTGVASSRNWGNIGEDSFVPFGFPLFPLDARFRVPKLVVSSEKSTNVHISISFASRREFSVLVGREQNITEQANRVVWCRFLFGTAWGDLDQTVVGGNGDDLNDQPQGRCAWDGVWQKRAKVWGMKQRLRLERLYSELELLGLKTDNH